MLLGKRFESFVEKSPVSVMMRGIVERIFHPDRLEQIFEEYAVKQYTHLLPFHSVAEVLSEVVFNITPSVGAGLQAREGTMPVSRRSFYNKLNNVEPCVGAALVADSAKQVELVIEELQVRRTPLLKGFHTRVLDGNHFAATEHRLEVLRHDTAAPLPGQALVVLDGDLRLVRNVFPCEDAHAQERSLLHLVLPTMRYNDVWIADRNFCTLMFLISVARRMVKFAIRHHANIPYTLIGKQKVCGRTETGQVFEQAAHIFDPVTGEKFRIRVITILLDNPTRDKDRELRVLTNLSVNQATGIQVAELYRKRWTIESMFQELTEHLTCEIRTLAYPKAALFAFCLALVAWNGVSLLLAALAAVHGEEHVDQNVSGFYIALEISLVTNGMMIAIPEKYWSPFRDLNPAQLAQTLKDLAKNVNLAKYKSHPRGPKGPKTKRKYSGNGQHVATARLICRSK